MGKIKGFLFAVRHREILMTDLGLKPLPRAARSAASPSPSERGVNTLAYCWRTGRGDPVLLKFDIMSFC